MKRSSIQQVDSLAQEWDACTANGSRDATLHHFKALTFEEKIEWLEEAEEVALRLRAGCATVSEKQCPRGRENHGGHGGHGDGIGWASRLLRASVRKCFTEGREESKERPVKSVKSVVKETSEPRRS